MEAPCQLPLGLRVRFSSALLATRMAHSDVCCRILTCCVQLYRTHRTPVISRHDGESMVREGGILNVTLTVKSAETQMRQNAPKVIPSSAGPYLSYMMTVVVSPARTGYGSSRTSNGNPAQSPGAREPARCARSLASFSNAGRDTIALRGSWCGRCRPFTAPMICRPGSTRFTRPVRGRL